MKPIFNAIIIFPFALSLVVSNPTVVKADVELGDAISISIQGVGDANEARFGSKVFQDEQNSYYVKRNNGDIIKIQRGDDIKYRDKNGNIITVFQPEENLQASTDKVHDYKDSLLASLVPISVNIGDIIYPLNVPDLIEQEFLSLSPLAFGENPVNNVKFFGLGFSPSNISILGSTSLEGDVESAFSLDLGSEWIQLSSDLEGRLALEIISGSVIPSTSGNDVILVGETVPEPTCTLSLLALGTLGVGSSLFRKQTNKNP